ncbi:MAG TPA: class I SAM-dependent methyltransferase [Burkholderiales bacterium]|nr:class I SAM-dependent methyltransferase [Burkholderiales bacterium]
MSAMIEEHIFPGTAMPGQDWWHVLWPNPDAVIDVLGIDPEMTVVDLCCGDGYFTAAIARRLASGRVIGFDLDPVVLEQAKAVCNTMKNCTWLLGDAMELVKLITVAVDYVLIANTFHGVPNKMELACEVAKILKPDGYFAIVNWHALPREKTPVLGQPRGPRTESRMSPVEVSAVVVPAGFRRDRYVELPPYHYGAIFRKD